MIYCYCVLAVMSPIRMTWAAFLIKVRFGLDDMQPQKLRPMTMPAIDLAGAVLARPPSVKYSCAFQHRPPPPPPLYPSRTSAPSTPKWLSTKKQTRMAPPNLPQLGPLLDPQRSTSAVWPPDFQNSSHPPPESETKTSKAM